MEMTRSILSTLFAAAVVALPCLAQEAPPEPPEPAAPEAPAAPKPVELPGVKINLQERYVDVDATVCLDRGMLELIACTTNTKDHESIFVVNARPMHIHAGMLFLGLRNGNPAMHKQISKDPPRWVAIPPRGDLIDVSVVIKDLNGDPAEYPIGDFVTRSEDPEDQFAPPPVVEGDGDPTDDEFPSTFVFAGSQLVDSEKGDRKYIADESGHVISISTFGDEVLCLPGFQSQENGALVWEINSTLLPKIGTKVTLRLRPKAPDAEPAAGGPPAE